MEQRDEKKQVLSEALEGAPTVYIHLDARRDGVKVPDHHRQNPQLILRVGYMLTPPINIHLGDESVTCTLSFNRVPFGCELPWDAIYAIVGDDGRAAVWPDDIPPEAAKLKEAVQRAPLAAVPSPGEAPAKPDARPGAKNPKKLARPERLMPTVAERPVSVEPARKEKEKEKEIVGAGAEKGASEAPGPETPAPAGERKPKRELPPYLRVIK